MSVEVELTITDGQHLYYGREYEATGRFLTIAWLRTVEPPYLVGRGIRIRIKSNAWIVGVCKPTRPFARPVELTPEDIRGWQSDSDSSDQPTSVSP